MKKFIKIMGILLSVVFIGVVSGYVYLNKEYPKIEKAPDIKIDPTPERLSKGKYLFNSVYGCVDCHSQRDFTKLSGPVVPGTEGAGGQKIGEEFGLPGTLYTKNITPAGVGHWTDGELFRAITEGVNKDGEPLFPLMPYLVYGKQDKEDIYSIIAYMRTLPAVQNEVPKKELNFPMNLIERTIPTKSEFTKGPDALDKIAYGKYLVDGASCTDCHTPSVKGEPKMDEYLSGGQEIPLPENTVLRPANITPDKETGIGSWTKEQFIQRFKSSLKPEYRNTSIKPGEFNTIMPWTVYGTMTEEDLGAIYDYLMTVKPVKKQVVKFEKKSLY